MGRLGYEATITHFSHIHPLDLASLDQSLTPPTCAGCTLRASGYAYSCRTCGYVLHISCAQLPQLIRHPADSLHALPLLPLPAYPEGSFGCDACGLDGTGFSYHCTECGLDLHALCASMPLSVHPQAAHPHPLALVFVPPYENKGFSCDLCGGMGGNHWLYRCSVCEFDAHLGCASNAAAQAPAQLQQQQQIQARAAAPVGAMGVGNRGWQSGPAVGVPRAVNRAGSGSGHGGWQGGGAPAQNNGSLVNQAINKFVNNAAQQMGQNFAQSVFGGGGGASADGGGDGGGDASGSAFGEFGSDTGDVFGGSDS